MSSVERTALVGELTSSVLAALDNRAGQPPARAEATPPAPDKSADATAAKKEADDLIGRAASAETWTNSDRQTFRLLLARMAAPDLSDAMHALSRKINEGHLKVETSGPPF